MKTTTYLFLISFITVLILSGCKDPQPPLTSSQISDCAASLVQLDEEIRFHAKRMTKGKGSWLDLEKIAQGYLARARLSGRLEDFKKADQAIEQAFKAAPPNAGPFLTRARLNFTLHRFKSIEADLKQTEKAILVSPHVRRAIKELRAELLLLQGKYRQAKNAYASLLVQNRSMTGLSRMAALHWRMGDFPSAERLFEEASKTFDAQRGGQGRAWVELQRGLMDLDRGRLDDALVHYRTADTSFSGWYVVEEHIAEVLAAKGQLQAARLIYDRVIETTKSPELTGALAEALEQLGDKDAAKQQRALARTRWNAYLRDYPEAAYGHAIEFFLKHGTADEAFQLAERNHALRPQGDAKILWAQTMLRKNQVESAEKIIKEVLVSPFRSAALYATEALIYRNQGRDKEAESSEQAARAIDPAAVKELEWLAHL